MGNWRDATWGEEVSLEYGKALRGYQDAVAPYRVYGTNGPVGFTDTPLAPGPGVILGRKGAYRGVHFSPDPFFVIDTAYYVMPKSPDLNMRWLYYAIVHHKLGEIDDGSPVPSTTRAAVYVRNLKVPPTDEQKKICGVLGALDDKIDLNLRMNETLEAMARAIFKDWFVDFGPTRAKAEGRAPYLAPDIWDLFPDALDDGKPVGWPLGSLQDLLVLQRGFDLPKSQRSPGGYPVIAASGVHGTHSVPKVSGPGVVTGRSGVIGNVFYIHDDFWPLNTSLWVKDFPNSSPVHAYFLIQSLQFASFNAGSAVPTLNRNHVHGLPTPIPPKGFIQAFSEITEPIMRRQRQNEQENVVLAQTRNLLLPKLMSGEIRLKEAEIAIGEVA